MIRILTAAGVALAISAGALAQSATYPTKPIRWVVPYPAGSPVDVSARRFGESFAARLGQSIIVENKPGAYGSIGAADVARAAPDGYTMMMTIQDPLIAAAATVKGLPYDPVRDFKRISILTVSAAVVVINAKHGVASPRELIELAKKSDPPLAYGSWGPGSTPALVMESIAKAAGVTFREIQYRGSPPAMQDMLGGQIAFTLTAPNVAAPLVTAGKIKAVGVLGTKRVPALPTTETFVEAGYDNYMTRYLIWIALVGPAGLPEPIIDRTLSVARAALAEPGIKSYLAESGYEVLVNTPDEFEKMFQTEYALIPKMIRDELKVQAQ